MLLLRLVLAYPPLRRRLTARLEAADAEFDQLLRELIAAASPRGLSEATRYAIARRRAIFKAKLWDVLE